MLGKVCVIWLLRKAAAWMRPVAGDSQRRVLEFETGRDCLRPAPRARWRYHSPWRGALTQGGEPRAGPSLAKGSANGEWAPEGEDKAGGTAKSRLGAGKLPAECFQSIANLLTPPFGR
jgi:hypothetical protein